MKRSVPFASVVLIFLLLSVGLVSGAGVAGSTEAPARTAVHGPGADGVFMSSIPRDHAPDAPNSLDQRSGDGYFSVPDVLGQFDNLQIHGDPMNFHRGAGDDPTLTNHYQGMVRVDDSSGIPYIILTRSHHAGEDQPGELLVVEMESRVNRQGERLRSNVLEKGKSMGDTVAPISDQGVKSLHFDGQKHQDGRKWPPYSHPGGGQLLGDVLVVPLEFCLKSQDVAGGEPYYCEGSSDSQSAIALIDVSEPLTPTLLYSQKAWQTAGLDDYGLGVVGAAYVPQNDDIPRTKNGGRYLFIITWGTGNTVRFAWSNTDDLKTTTEFVVENFEWLDTGEGVLGFDWRNWQTLNFVRGDNDTLYLIGAQKDDISPDWDRLGLYEVDVSKLTEAEIQGAITFVAEKHLKLNDPVMGCLDAASGIYVSPSGQLILYTATHENDGPKDPYGTGTVQMGEFRNIDVYQEGTTARDTMCPWVELYREDRGWEEQQQSRSIMLDYQDQHLDDWYNLDQEDWNDVTSSYRTYLAPGQILRLYKDVNFEGDFIEITGNGSVQVDDKLSDNPGPGDWDWDDKFSSVLMFPFADTGGPYIIHEGSEITLDAANRCYLDDEARVTFTWSVDSSVCTLSDETARQPRLVCADDGKFRIESNAWMWDFVWHTDEETVTVENVAPLVTAEGSDTDENGWATVSGTITDPGTEDTFTVIIDWGEGSDTYSYPAGTTTYSEQHQYSSPIRTGVHPVKINVFDDDGGMGSAETFVNGIRVFLPLAVTD